MSNATWFKGKTKDENETVYICLQPDEMAENPRDDMEDDGTHFYTWLRRVNSPDENPYDNMEEFLEEISGREIHFPLKMTDLLEIPEIKDKYSIYPVYRFEHGGVAYQMGKSFNDRFDSCFAGFIYGEKEKMKKYYGIEDEERRRKILDSHVKDYSLWANGDCWFASLYDIYYNDMDENMTFLSELYDSPDIIKEGYRLVEIEEVRYEDIPWMTDPEDMFETHETANILRYRDMFAASQGKTSSVEEVIESILMLGTGDFFLKGEDGELITMQVPQDVRNEEKLWKDYARAFWNAIPKRTAELILSDRSGELRLMKNDEEPVIINSGR